jgi:subtilisin-like proprotein convertase family protein
MGNITTEVFISIEWGTLPTTANVALGEEHSFYGDLDMMLQAPGGQLLLFLSDAGSTNDANGSYTFRDGFAAMQSSGTNINQANGNYGVSQYGTGDVFLAPSPAASYTNTTFAGAFNGLNPNGTWNLWIMDDAGGDAGWIMSSTLSVSAVPEPGTIAVLGLGVAALLRRRKK